MIGKKLVLVLAVIGLNARPAGALNMTVGKSGEGGTFEDSCTLSAELAHGGPIQAHVEVSTGAITIDSFNVSVTRRSGGVCCFGNWSKSYASPCERLSASASAARPVVGRGGKKGKMPLKAKSKNPQKKPVKPAALKKPAPKTKSPAVPKYRCIR